MKDKMKKLRESEEVKEDAVKEAIYDPGDTIPPQGPDPDSEDDPLYAVKFIEQSGLGPDDTVISMFTPDEKQKLIKMMKAGEFSRQEAAIIRLLMSECAKAEEIKQMSDMQREAAKGQLHIGDPATLDDVGVMIGSASRRSKGKPVSKVAALKEVNRIGAIVAKRSKAKYGKEIDFSNIPKFKKEMQKNIEWKKKKAREAERYANQQEREFHKIMAELNRVRKAHGLPPERAYVRYYAPQDKDISKMKRFGGTPDER